MEEIEIHNLWRSQNARIEQTLALNLRLLRETTNLKAQSVLHRLLRFKGVGIAIFVLYLSFLFSILAFAIAHYASGWNYFILSVGAIALINLRGLADYVKHAYWLSTINFDGSVTQIQQQLARLQLSILRHTRIMFLQFPFFSTFFLSDTWFPQTVPWPYLLLQIGVTSGLTALSIWLYRQHRSANLSQKWLRVLLGGSGGNAVMKAMAFYKELNEFSGQEE